MRGRGAIWLRFFIHPSAETSAGEIVQMAVKIAGSRNGKKVYCCVRRYEGWSPAALARTNFELWSSQAVLVKHTVQHVRRQMPSLGEVDRKQRAASIYANDSFLPGS